MSPLFNLIFQKLIKVKEVEEMKKEKKRKENPSDRLFTLVHSIKTAPLYK